ncbi:MAG TPA: ABC transporter substrate-binding protein [Polyangia bacterium]|nr:ABC transporter substrate-binding protein [Polyangia bacterium]
MTLSRRYAAAAFVAAPLVGAAMLGRRVRGALVGTRAFTDSRVEGAAFPRRLVDPAGVVRSLPAPPGRIVSTYLACEENLAALVPVERVAAVSVYADDRSVSNCLGVYPPRVSRLRSDPEQVLAADPDLVCVSGYNALESVRLLEAAGVPLLRQSQIASFADMTAGIRVLGAAVGADERAEALVRDIEIALAEADRRVGRARRVRVLYFDPLGYTMGAGTIVDEILSRAGGRNVALELGLRGSGEIGVEALFALEPEAIVMPRYDDVMPALAALSRNEIWNRVPAVAAGRLYGVPAAWVNTESFHAARGLSRVARLLHPEAFAG